jgi:calpain-15
VVTVDDYIPCFYNGGPMFSRSNGNELWVLLLEKAYAKLHGHYYSLRFGQTLQGLMDLTGCPTEAISFKNFANDYNSLFNFLKEYDELGYMMTCDTSGHDDVTEGGGPKKSGGIVSGHAYSLIGVKEHGSV